MILRRISTLGTVALLPLAACDSRNFDDMLQTSMEMEAYSAGCGAEASRGKPLSESRDCKYFVSARKRFQQQVVSKYVAVGDTFGIGHCPNRCKAAFNHSTEAERKFYRALAIAAAPEGVDIDEALNSGKFEQVARSIQANRQGTASAGLGR